MDKKDLLVLGAGAAIGALAGLGLSFTALSPLVMGGIVAAIPITLLCVVALCASAEEGELSKEGFLYIASLCVASAAIGAGLAAAATAFSLVQCLEQDQQL